MPKRKRRISGKVLSEYNYQCAYCSTVVRTGADLTEFERRHGRLAALLAKDVATCQPCVDRMTDEGPHIVFMANEAVTKAFEPRTPRDQDLHDPLTCEVCVEVRRVEQALYQRNSDHCDVCKRGIREVTPMYDICIVWRKEVRKHTLANFQPYNLLWACTECRQRSGLNRAMPREPEQSRILTHQGNVIYVDIRYFQYLL